MMKNIYIAALFILTGCTAANNTPTEWVDPMIGTGFHGHTYPGATVPFGAVQLSPDTRTGDWDACSGYHYDDNSILGFSHTHLSGTGCADLADILFHPTNKEIEPSSERYIFTPLVFSHKDEKASVGYYRVKFRNEGITAELTAAPHTGIHRYTFAKGGIRQLVIDMNHTLTEQNIDSVTIYQSAPNEVCGMRRSQGWSPNRYIFFTAQFSEDIISAKLIDNGRWCEDNNPKSKNLQLVLTFAPHKKEPLVSKVGLSVVSTDNARKNMLDEVSGFDFDAAHRSAVKLWDEALNDIVVAGGSDEDMRLFYTAQYHTKIAPNRLNDINGEYRRHNNTIAKLQENRTYYSTLSIWDIFRAWSPLQTLVNAPLINDIICSMLDMYDATGELPIWPLSSGETFTMIGYHSVSIIADAYMKGIRNYDVEKAFEAMKHSSNINKKGSELYLKLGYIPSNIKKESVSCLLEYAYDDWTIAMMAKELGRKDDFELYTKRALNYINVFDGYTGFMRGRRTDGGWSSPFNQFEAGRDYTEATPWQYRFFVPHDINGLMMLLGDKERFIEELDRLFTLESDAPDFVDITGIIGQYAHGNEPSHHMAYLYNYAQMPWKSQQMTRRLLKEMYKPTPDGIIGNEDCGQMSAWYIFSSLGLYPVCPASNQYVLTTPLFPNARVNLSNGKVLTITANDPDKNHYIESVSLNGEVIEQNYVTHQMLLEGGDLRFTLTDKPNMERGTKPEAAPYSLSVDPSVSIPYIDCDVNLFTEPQKVAISSRTTGSKIHYTTDGSEPTEDSPLYTSPLLVDKSLTIKAKGYKEGAIASRTMVVSATKAVFDTALGVESDELVNGTNYLYYEGVFSQVEDIAKGAKSGEGIMEEPSIANTPAKDHFGYIFSGLIYVPESNVIEFFTRSDDGSMLFINDKLVVDNNGSHGAVTATGRIALKQGYHNYKLLYFEDYEGEELNWGWKMGDAPNFSPIDKANLFIRK